jgi:hypothetical protein
MRSGLNDIHCATVLQLERHSLAAPRPSPATRAAGHQPSIFSIASHPHVCLSHPGRLVTLSFGETPPHPHPAHACTRPAAADAFAYASATVRRLCIVPAHGWCGGEPVLPARPRSSP